MRGSCVLPRPVVWVTSASTPPGRWRAARRAGVGGSDVAAILGRSTFASPWQVWAEKTGAVDPAPASEAMAWGSAIEDTVARVWADRYGVRVRRVGMVADPVHPWRLGSLDRVTVPAGSLAADGLLECKTTSERSGDLSDDALAARYATQVQWYLGITGLRRAWLPVLVGGQELRELTVDADPDLFAALAEQVDDWWHRHVVAGVPPIVTGADLQALNRVPAADGGGPLPAGQDLLDLLALRASLRQMRGHVAGQLDWAEARIKAALGPADTAVDADGRPLVTWRPQTTTSLDRGRLKHDHPDLYDAYLKRSTTRVLRVPEKKEPS